MKLDRDSVHVLRYTVLLSLTALAGAGVLVPLINWFFHPELTLYTLVLGQIVTALVAPPICYWSASQYVVLRKTRMRLEQQNEELVAAKASAEEAAEMKSRFLAIMSHEIRTPLNGVLGMAQLLARRPLDSEDKILADTLLESGQSLMTLLNDLLDLSRSEAGQMEVNPVPASPANELRQIQLLFAPVAAEKAVTFRVEMAGDLPDQLILDPVRLRQCVGNLVSNAIKFTTEGHVVVRATMHTADRLEIAVEDTGPGLSPAEQARVFDAFAQANATTGQNHGGSGLGLTICRQLAQLMGGDVTLRSTPGAGSVFLLSLSVAQVRNGGADGAHMGSGQSHPPEEWLDGCDVLVVDDVATNRLVLAALLERAGAVVRQAAGGAEAVEAHRQAPADLVLLDLQMPEMDGFETAGHLRAGPVGNVPIIAISAHAQPEDRKACVAARMNGLMLKPIELRALYSEIARLGLFGSGTQSDDRDIDAA